MSFTPFPAQQYVRALESDTLTGCGYISVPSAFELQNIRMRIFILGALQGSEKMRLHVYGSSALVTPIASSAWANLADVGTYSPNFIGEIWFDFTNSIPMNPNNFYHVQVETDNYTRIGDAFSDTFFVGYCLDWYDDLNEHLDTSAGARMALAGIA